MRFGLYLLSVLANLVVVAFVPTSLAKEFLFSYATFSLAGGIALVLAFASQYFVARVIWWLPPVLVSLALLSLLIPRPGLWILYSGVLLASDYTTSQSRSVPLTDTYRAALVLSALPFAIMPERFTELVVIRTFVCGVFILKVLLQHNALSALAIRRSVMYVSVSHVAYFGTLLLITVLLTGDALKYWYIGAQIGLGLLLKHIDFSIRGTVSKPIRFALATLFASIGIAALLMVLHASPFALFVYLMGLLVITQLRRLVH